MSFFATDGVKDWQSMEALRLMKATTGALTTSTIDGRSFEPPQPDAAHRDAAHSATADTERARTIRQA
jgi:hypothetical protein